MRTTHSAPCVSHVHRFAESWTGNQVKPAFSVETLNINHLYFHVSFDRSYKELHVALEPQVDPVERAFFLFILGQMLRLACFSLKASDGVKLLKTLDF